MTKKQLKPSTLLGVAPAVLVTCQDRGGRPNIITLAWSGIVCSDPPMLSVSIRPSRYSHGIIKETREFVVNIPPAELVRKVDLCGIVSGRDRDKFSEAGLTAAPSDKVAPPIIDECTVNLECRVTEVIPLGVHDLFLGEIVAAHVAAEALDEKGQVVMQRVDPLVYCPPDHSYRAVGDALGTYGYSRKA